jgi:outer membrane lipoprotein-sorting protein
MKTKDTTLPMLYIFGSLLSAGLLSANAQENSLAARQILDRMADTYAHCQSYQDTGILKENYSPSVTEDKEILFTTAFIRPDCFRFEYQKQEKSSLSRYIIWAKGKDVRSWWNRKGSIEKTTSLDFALAAATGISSGTANHIPALLLPEQIKGRRFTDMTQIKRIEDGKLDSIDCFLIQGSYEGREIILWIDKKTFLVYQMEMRYKFLGVDVVRTIRYDPRINAEISEEKLKFNAPVNN